jgi:nucleotide-binding universal stress UspA family protein
MPTLTIDGRTVTVPEGATILDAARALAIDVPTLCWYPKLPVVGNCRICLVQVDGAPKLIAACATAATEGMRVDYRVKNSLSIASGILEEADAGNYDLILLATSTYRKRLKHIFGSNLDEIVRRARVETIVLRYMEDKAMSYKKILIPTSGYQHSVGAAMLAAELYRKHGSDITVLYIGESNEDAANALKPVSQRLNAAGIKHRALHRKGPIVETILDEADKGYDLMMIGATERPAYYNFLLGSTADRLVKRSPCPILMVKSVGG